MPKMQWSKTARQYLEALQESTISSSSSSKIVFERLKSHLEKNAVPGDPCSRKKIPPDKDNVPTKYEISFYYNQLIQYALLIEQGVEKMFSKKLEVKPYLGTSYKLAIGAATLKIPNTNDFLLFYDIGVFLFYHYLINIITKTLSIKFERGDELIALQSSFDEKMIKKNKDYCKQFVGLYDALMYPENYYKLSLFALNQDEEIFQHFLRETILAFTMAHEYSHLVNQNIGNTKSLSDMTIEEFQKKWREEFLADIVGHGLICLSIKHIPSIITVISPDIFFHSMEIAERVRFALINGEKWEEEYISHNNFARRSFKEQELAIRRETHPPFRDRRLASLEAARETNPFFNDKEVTALRCSINTSLEFLWKQSLPFWIKKHKEGYRPPFYVVYPKKEMIIKIR